MAKILEKIAASVVFRLEMGIAPENRVKP